MAITCAGRSTADEWRSSDTGTGSTPAASAVSTTARTSGESVGSALDELLEVARRRGHELVEEERRLRHHHREPRGRLAFDSEVRESHRSRLSGRAARDLCMAYNERVPI